MALKRKPRERIYLVNNQPLAPIEQALRITADKSRQHRRKRTKHDPYAELAKAIKAKAKQLGIKIGRCDRQVAKALLLGMKYERVLKRQKWIRIP
jgi:hypothetical protein